MTFKFELKVSLANTIGISQETSGILNGMAGSLFSASLTVLALSALAHYNKITYNYNPTIEHQ